MEPRVQYARSSDGTSIAFYEMGEGTPLVIASNIWNHLTVSWRGEVIDATLQLVRDGFRLIRYDMRGFGMSDRDVSDFSLDAQMADLETLRASLNLERFALYGHVFATPACIAYAARYPDRLTHLVLTVPFARGEDWYRAMPTLQGLESFREFGEKQDQEQWELYTLMHATALLRMSGATVDAAELAGVMRSSASPATLSRYFETLLKQDVTQQLADIHTPTLILITERAAGASFSNVVARGIAGSHLAMLGTALTMPSMVEAAAVTEFVLGHEPVGGRTSAASEPLPSGTAIILFADIVDSAGLTERIGDTAFREKARGLDEAMRAAIRDNGGSAVEGKTLGDGVLAVFTSAKQAIVCAQACHDAADAAGLSLHAGIHAGDVIREADPDGRSNVYGGAVNIAARVAAASAAGETLVSGTVRELARTSAGVTFEDRGEQALKGIEEPVRVWAVVVASGQAEA